MHGKGYFVMRRAFSLVAYKCHFKSECERQAWDIYGGPTGLAAAQRRYDPSLNICLYYEFTLY